MTSPEELLNGNETRRHKCQKRKRSVLAGNWQQGCLKETMGPRTLDC